MYETNSTMFYCLACSRRSDSVERRVGGTHRKDLASPSFADSRYFADTEVLNNYALIMQEKSLFR